MTDAGIRVVVIPGTHDVYDSRSIYRAFDLAHWPACPPAVSCCTVLTPERPELLFADLDLVVYGRVFATKRAPRSPLEGFDVRADERASWKVGIYRWLALHRRQGRARRRPLQRRGGRRQRARLPGAGPLASFLSGRAGATTWAYPGAPEPVAVDQDGAGDVCLVRLEDGTGGRSSVHVERVRVGRTGLPQRRVRRRRAGQPGGARAATCRAGRPRPGPRRDHRRHRAGQPRDRIPTRSSASWRRRSCSCASRTARPGGGPGPQLPADTVAGRFMRRGGASRRCRGERGPCRRRAGPPGAAARTPPAPRRPRPRDAGLSRAHHPPGPQRLQAPRSAGHRAGGRSDHRPRAQRGRQVDHPGGPRAGALPQGRRRPRGHPQLAAGAARRPPRSSSSSRRTVGRAAVEALRRPAGGGRADARGQTSRDFALIQAQVADLTGIPSEAFFRATAGVGHAELDAVASDEPAISDRLQLAVSGADRGTAKAKKKLDAAIQRYRPEGLKNPGLLKAAREEIGLLEPSWRGRGGPRATGGGPAARAEARRAARRRLDGAAAARAGRPGRGQRAEALVPGARPRRSATSARSGPPSWSRRPSARAARCPPRVAAGRCAAPSPGSSLAYEISELEAELDVEADVTRSTRVGTRRRDRCAGWPSRPSSSSSVGCSASWSVAWPAGPAWSSARSSRSGPGAGLPGRRAPPSARPRHAPGPGRRDAAQDRNGARRSASAVAPRAGAGCSRSRRRTSPRPRRSWPPSEQHTERLAHIEGELRGLGVEERNLRRLVKPATRRPMTPSRPAIALAGMGDLGVTRRPSARPPSASSSRPSRPATAHGPRRTRRRAASTPTSWTPSWWRASPSGSPRRASGTPSWSVACSSTRPRGRPSRRPSRPPSRPRPATSRSTWARPSRASPAGAIATSRSTTRASPSGCARRRRGRSWMSGSSRRARPTSSSWPPASAWSAS